MSTSIYTPYFYIIQHIDSGKYYAGSKYGKNANPDQLLKSNGYQTSSNTVKQIILNEGIECFVIRKIRVFETGEEALEYESRFLRRVNAASNDKFLNRSNNYTNNLNVDLEKSKQTNLERYGFEYIGQVPEFQEKRKQTCLERYGVSHNFQIPEFQEKRKQNCLEQYGVEYHTMALEIKEKKKQNNLEKYGVTNVLQTESVKELMLIKYGYENASQAPEIREKTRLTTLSRHGHENISQVPHIKERKLKILSDLLNQPTIVEIRKYRDKFKVKLGNNWYHKNQEILDNLLAELKLTYGEMTPNNPGV